MQKVAARSVFPVILLLVFDRRNISGRFSIQIDDKCNYLVHFMFNQITVGTRFSYCTIVIVMYATKSSPDCSAQLF